MKYIHTTAVLFVATLFLTTLFSSCSPDTEKEDGILIEMGEDGVRVTTTVDGVTTVHEERTGVSSAEPNPEHNPEPQPDWADNVMTITVGRFDTKEDLVSEFRRRRRGGMTLSGSLHNWTVAKERGGIWEEFRITPPENAYTVDITLISMQDAGFEKPATIAEVRERIIAMGFEPITYEEAYEIRLQLKDQPSWKTRHPWSNFRSLPVEEEMLRMLGGKEVSALIYNWGKKYGIGVVTYQRIGPGIKNDELLIPSEEFRKDTTESVTNPKFACAIPETRKRK